MDLAAGNYSRRQIKKQGRHAEQLLGVSTAAEFQGAIARGDGVLRLLLRAISHRCPSGKTHQPCHMRIAWRDGSRRAYESAQFCVSDTERARLRNHGHSIHSAL